MLISIPWDGEILSIFFHPTFFGRELLKNGAGLQWLLITVSSACICGFLERQAHQAFVIPSSQIFCWEFPPQCKPSNQHQFQAGFQGGPCSEEQKMLFQSDTVTLVTYMFHKMLL